MSPNPSSCFVHVTMCGRRGWDSRRLTLAQFARARSSLQRLPVLFVELQGPLA